MLLAISLDYITPIIGPIIGACVGMNIVYSIKSIQAIRVLQNKLRGFSYHNEKSVDIDEICTAMDSSLRNNVDDDHIGRLPTKGVKNNIGSNTKFIPHEQAITLDEIQNLWTLTKDNKKQLDREITQYNKDINEIKKDINILPDPDNDGNNNVPYVLGALMGSILAVNVQSSAKEENQGPHDLVVS